MRHIISCKAALLATLGLATSSLSNAGISDRTNFNVPPIVILWAANDDTGEVPIVTDFIIQASNGLNTDLINVDGRTVATVTGALIPTTDAAFVSNSIANFRVTGSPTTSVIPIDTEELTSFNAFELNNGTSILHTNGLFHSSDFFIASNTPFNITTSVDEVQTSGGLSLDDILFYYFVDTNGANAPIPYGASAKDPGGIQVQLQPLGDIDGVDIWQSATSTAASIGSIADQSVRIQLNYELAQGQNIDLSYGSGTVIADVTYTAYVP